MCELAAAGAHEEALGIVEQARQTDLRDLVRLFAAAVECVRESDREVAVVLRQGRQSIAVSVDEAERVEIVDVNKFEQVPETVGREHARTTPNVAHRGDSAKLALVVDVPVLFDVCRTQSRAQVPLAAAA